MLLDIGFGSDQVRAYAAQALGRETVTVVVNTKRNRLAGNVQANLNVWTFRIQRILYLKYAF